MIENLPAHLPCVPEASRIPLGVRDDCNVAIYVERRE